MKKFSSYKKITRLIIFYLVILNSLILTKLIFYRIPAGYPQKSVLGFTYPPTIPDFSANSGGVKTLGEVTAIVEENTFPHDTYFWVNPRTKTTPVFVSGYFQISDMYEAWMRKQSDNSKIVYPPKKYILSFAYQEAWLITDQGVLFPETSIHIAHANIYDSTWTLLSTAVNTLQNTAATITDKGGFFMLTSGFGTLLPTSTPTPTLTPTPTVTPTQGPSKTPTPTVFPTTARPTDAPTITPPKVSVVPTVVPQKITFQSPSVKRKDFLDRIIDAVFLIFFDK